MKPGRRAALTGQTIAALAAASTASLLVGVLVWRTDDRSPPVSAGAAAAAVEPEPARSTAAGSPSPSGSLHGMSAGDAPIVDDARARWARRIDAYQRERASLLAAGEVDPEELAALRARHFDAEELRRVRALEGGSPP